MTMITPSYLGETIEYSSLHACRSTLEDPTLTSRVLCATFESSAPLVAGRRTQILELRVLRNPVLFT